MCHGRDTECCIFVQASEDRSSEIPIHVVSAETGHYDEEQNRQSSTSSNEGLQFTHLLLQFSLFLRHCIFAFAQEKLIVFVHGEGTAIDEKDNQYQSDRAPQNKQHDDRRQSRHIHLDGFKSGPSNSRSRSHTNRRGRYRRAIWNIWDPICGHYSPVLFVCNCVAEEFGSLQNQLWIWAQRSNLEKDGCELI